mmetsp:Transcript_31601/g.82618  ORF Transcript_31601/g.82618 Transcript_31601/m.82618 type:complete len:288 (-) Transcript_31601:529-1392(-)
MAIVHEVEIALNVHRHGRNTLLLGVGVGNYPPTSTCSCVRSSACVRESSEVQRGAHCTGAHSMLTQRQHTVSRRVLPPRHSSLAILRERPTSQRPVDAMNSASCVCHGTAPLSTRLIRSRASAGSGHHSKIVVRVERGGTDSDDQPERAEPTLPGRLRRRCPPLELRLVDLEITGVDAEAARHFHRRLDPVLEERHGEADVCAHKPHVAFPLQIGQLLHRSLRRWRHDRPLEGEVGDHRGLRRLEIGIPRLVDGGGAELAAQCVVNAVHDHRHRRRVRLRRGHNVQW